MNGLVFTEFLEMVEKKFGYQVTDTVIENACLPSGGAYTSIGYYNPQELLSLAQCLSPLINIPTEKLLFQYGEYFFSRLIELYPEFLRKATSAFDFLQEIATLLYLQHCPVKINPYVTCTFLQPAAGVMFVSHQAPAGIHKFIGGLIKACCSYFKEQVQINLEIIRGIRPTVQFELTNLTVAELAI